MKTDDDLVKSKSDNYPKGEELITKLNYKPNYTERTDYKHHQFLEQNMKSDFTNGQNKKELYVKTRNDWKRGHKQHKGSNLHNFSSSSIFSLSHDDTLKSGENRSKFGVC